MSNKVAHTTIRNQNLFCTNCGEQHVIVYPIDMKILNSKISAFNDLHKDCKKTWNEIVVNQDKSTYEKAMFWMSHCQVGMSSKTMWNCLLGHSDFEINHPYDPDDFSRCYKLLEVVPEWKSELWKLRTLSKSWWNLVEKWDVLTEMYELNVKTKWKDSKKIGMYEFMQTLIKE